MDLPSTSQYTYTPLPPDSNSIRVLRLLPNKDKTAPIKCDLVEYPLPESETGSHPYEALSYVWGTGSNPQPIFIDGHSLQVTGNLHAALLRLRDHGLERTLWVDALCINQSDDKEKSHQVPMMGTIYGQAGNVIVWLGEAENRSNEAMESIRLAARDERNLTHVSMDRFLRKVQKKDPEVPAVWNQGSSLEAAMMLLQRAWFRRIWVLQEVGLARSIQIVCGPGTLSGYTFVLGLQKMELPYKAHPGLEGLVSSVFDLIKGSIFRSEYQAHSPGQLPISELIDRYHTHEATWSHDKIYGLLGMSSDDPDIPALKPNYELPWDTVFRQVLEYIIPRPVSVTTWSDKEAAVIKTKGYILGMIETTKNHNSRTTVTLVSKQFSMKGNEKDEWVVQASAEPIQEGDIVCLLQETSKPSIIRPYRGYFAVIMIGTTFEYVSTHLKVKDFDRTYHPRRTALQDLLLVWNWESRSGDAHEKELKLVIDAQNTHARGAGSNQDLSSLAPVWEDIVETAARGKAKRMEVLFEMLGDNVPVTEATVVAAAGNYEIGTALLKLLFERKGENLPITLEVVKAAARALASVERMNLLLKQKGDNLPITEEVLKIGIGSYHGYDLMKLLMNQRGEHLPITEEVVKTAMQDYRGYEMTKLFLEHRGENLPITEEVVKTAATSSQGCKIMQLLLEQRGESLPITEAVIKAAAEEERQTPFKVEDLNRRKRITEFLVHHTKERLPEHVFQMPAVKRLLEGSGIPNKS
ncbi:HET-domain-containing protein [Aspergillus sclerotiicarbonarius CBS 121057]|uniref:HET-domain-containing protein n=1 Tax=Aspergillus sclerotiicarbonarius (strain CBS 121057 / IBT 28362) TaxID=1448318 RepID=A0A319EMC2_ASPSB|nr:HET-domain-containing protein [Aspergillus sclerotiicarbonarius CBS 121057]